MADAIRPRRGPSPTDEHRNSVNQCQDGASPEVHYKAGQFRWAVSTPGVDLSSQSAYQEGNLSDEPFESIRP
jgi:hypothetical protein